MYIFIFIINLLQLEHVLPKDGGWIILAKIINSLSNIIISFTIQSDFCMLFK